MIVDLLLGAMAMWILIYLADYAQQQELNLKWWHWTLTILAILYTIFVIEVMLGFLGEGEVKAVSVMGFILGLIAVVWAVLLARFVFSKPPQPAPKAK